MDFSFFVHIYVIYFHLLGRDVIVITGWGTDETATFAIPILQQLNIEVKDCQALILTSTRGRAHEVYIFYLLISLISLLFRSKR